VTPPSEPLIRRLRGLVARRGESVDAFSARIGMPSGHLQAALDGISPMTVDELVAILEALDLGHDELAAALRQGADPLPYEAPFGLEDDLDDDLDDEPDLASALDPTDNQVRQLFEVGFGLQCDFFFHAAVSRLEGSGVPRAVLERYRDGLLPIKLDALYHRYNEPRYEPAGVRLMLSFDSVYDCFFPWDAIQRITFSPVAPEPPTQQPEPEPEPPGRKAPFLRLVE
jgi:hypothetical protein